VEPVTSLDAHANPRAAVDDVYRVIVEDLQFAEANLPDRFDLADVGRATRWAAKTLLADVYLTREQYAQAAAKAKEVMDSGRFSLVEVREPDDFLKIFGPEVIESSEEILSVKFSSAGGGNTDLVAYTHNPGAGHTPVGFRTLLGEPRSQVLATWHEQDLRRLYKLYSADPNDSRFLTASEPELFKKYRDPTGSGNTDIPVFRYPEVLLIFAEAEAAASGGPTPAAYEALNRVRRRAFGHDSLIPSPADLAGLGAAEFRDAVLMERAWEFVLEAKRWFDLVRTGTLVERVQTHSETGSNNVRPHHVLRPIPQTQIDRTLNADGVAFGQNPGYPGAS
jgi:hypothetical protein